MDKFFTYDGIQFYDDKKRCLFNLEPQHAENNVRTRESRDNG